MTGLIESLNIVSESTPCMEVSDPAVLAKIPLVSVKMITYNHELYIAQAIEGVLQQETSFPVELIIGEDCSTDGTRAIVFNYQKKYPNIIRVITSEKNVGARKNSKRLNKACRGKYIAFCEGDDYWHHPGKIQKQIDQMESHPDVGLIHSDVDRYNVGKKVRESSYHKERRLLYKCENMLHGMIVNEYIVETCTAVVRSDLLNNIHEECQYEFSDKFMMGDVQTWIEIAYRSKVKYIDESFATRNLLPESACHSRDANKNIKFWENCKILHLHYANKYGGDESDNLKKIIVTLFNRPLSRLVHETRNSELGMEIIEDTRKHGVSLGPVSYLYLVGSKNNYSSKIIRLFIPSILLFRRLLLQVKWVRILRDRIKQ